MKGYHPLPLLKQEGSYYLPISALGKNERCQTVSNGEKKSPLLDKEGVGGGEVRGGGAESNGFPKFRKRNIYNNISIALSPRKSVR